MELSSQFWEDYSSDRGGVGSNNVCWIASRQPLKIQPYLVPMHWALFSQAGDSASLPDDWAESHLVSKHTTSGLIPIIREQHFKTFIYLSIYLSNMKWHLPGCSERVRCSPLFALSLVRDTLLPHLEHFCSHHSWLSYPSWLCLVPPSIYLVYLKSHSCKSWCSVVAMELSCKPRSPRFGSCFCHKLTMRFWHVPEANHILSAPSLLLMVLLGSTPGSRSASWYSDNGCHWEGVFPASAVVPAVSLTAACTPQI